MRRGCEGLLGSTGVRDGTGGRLHPGDEGVHPLNEHLREGERALHRKG
ncbi:MAG: hypothetical protein AB7S61_01305 [Methanoregulaceae archaeon]